MNLGEASRQYQIALEYYRRAFEQAHEDDLCAMSDEVSAAEHQLECAWRADWLRKAAA